MFYSLDYQEVDLLLYAVTFTIFCPLLGNCPQKYIYFWTNIQKILPQYLQAAQNFLMQHMVGNLTLNVTRSFIKQWVQGAWGCRPSKCGLVIIHFHAMFAVLYLAHFLIDWYDFFIVR